MRIAQDAIPGPIIPMWFKPIKPGTYEMVCGQLCGLGHYSMKGTLVVDTPADYQAWLKERVELSGNAKRAAPDCATAGRAAAGSDSRHGAAAGRTENRKSDRRRIVPTFCCSGGLRPSHYFRVGIIVRERERNFIRECSGPRTPPQ